MAAKRAERLVNLVIALLSTRQYVTAARIRATVPGYEPDDGTDRADEAFKRMFERDKAELREMGVPLETGRTSAFDTEDGYRIARADYELPEIQLTGEEAAAVGLALRLWESAQLAGAAHSALVKLKAAGVDVDTARGHPAAAAPGRRRARLRALLRRRPRPPGSSSSTTSAPTRTPRPAGASSRGASSPGTAAGTSVGLDLDRERAAGVPALPRRRHPEGRPARPVRSSRRPTSTSPPWSPARSAGEEHVVVVRARPGTADRPAPARHAAGHRRRRRRPARAAHHRAVGGWPTSSPPYGADVVVESPAEVRDAVIDRLTRLAAMGSAGMSATGTTDRMTRLLALVPYLTARPGRRRAWPRRPATSASPSGSCAATSSCCGCAGCPATAPATSSTSPSRATGCGSPSPPAWSARCG